ncbi:hypothetical protein KSP39_PZI017394 [Platanthera zijinensis]|uniref:Uncharacterized protein n=1 Tax=Platanthera zijinensis TaxID=2320716 RepID=A0AAP0FZI1_9ASPA
MLFLRCDNMLVIKKNARRMMMHLSIFTDDDIQVTLSFFEKVSCIMLTYLFASFPSTFFSKGNVSLQFFNSCRLYYYLEPAGSAPSRHSALFCASLPKRFGRHRVTTCIMAYISFS